MLENLKLGPRYDGFLFLAETARNPPVLKSHRHVELELNLVVRGEITYVVGGRRFTFGRGALLWMFPAQEHQLVDRTGDAQYYVAVFKPKLIARACRAEIYEGLMRDNVEGDGVLHTHIEPKRFELLRQTMDVLMEGSLDSDLLNREAGFGAGSDFRFEHGDPDGLNAGLRHLLLFCWRCQRAGKAGARAVALHPAVRKALTLLGEQDCEDDFGELARRCGVSDAYLSRIFARQMGVPLGRYRNSVRLGRFWDAFHQPRQQTIAEAVFAAGFGSYAQFYKVFFDAYGVGPRKCLKTRG